MMDAKNYTVRADDPYSALPAVLLLFGDDGWSSKFVSDPLLQVFTTSWYDKINCFGSLRGGNHELRNLFCRNSGP